MTPSFMWSSISASPWDNSCPGAERHITADATEYLLCGAPHNKYTRKQALEDGILVDISELAREAGIKFPVAVTQGVFRVLNDTEAPGQDFKGRTWDLLMVFRICIRSSKGDEVHFAPLFLMGKSENPKPVPLWAKCGPGDEGEPVITIMLEGED